MKDFLQLAAIAMASMMNNDYFDVTEERKVINAKATERLKNLYHKETHYHKYVIKGIEIEAKDKKTAIKIYNRKYEK